MLRRAWKPVAATVAIGGPAYLIYSTTARRQTFDLQIPVRDADGRREYRTKTFSLLPLDEVESRLRANATSNSLTRPDGFSWNYANAFLPSNDPIEDAHSHSIVQRDDKSGDYALFSVMDGHGGFQTSRLLADHLTYAVVASLSKTIADSAGKSPLTGFINGVKSTVVGTLPADARPEVVSSAIADAFEGLDAELMKSPMRLLAANWSETSRKANLYPDLSQHPDALKMMLPALSGTSF